MTATTVADRAPGTYRSTLAIPDFRRLFTAMAVWETGAWSYSIVLTAYLYTQSGSATAVAWLVTSRWITCFLVAPYAGVLADRFDRKRLMVVCACLSMVTMLTMAGALVAALPLWVLVALSILNSVLETPNRPASGAMVPELVGDRDLPAANSLLNVLENVVVAVGPAIGGLVILVADPVVGILLNASTYAIAAVLVSGVSLHSTGDAERGEGALRQIVEGLGSLCRSRVAVGASLATAICSGVYGAAVIVLVPLASSTGAGPGAYGWLLMASAVGSVAAAPLANRLARARRIHLVVVTALVVEAAPFALMVVVDGLVGMAALMAVSGAAMMVVDVIALTLVQRAVPDGVLGRVLAAFDAFAMGGVAAAGVASGVLLDTVGTDTTLLVIAVGTSALGLVCVPTLRGAQGPAPQIEEGVDLLQRVDLFHGVARPALEALAARAEHVAVAEGDVVITEGDPATDLWLVQSGALAAHAGGKELPTTPAPGYVGEIGLMHGRPRTATVVASVDSVLLRVPGEAFLEVLGSGEPSASLVRLADERVRRTR